MTLYDKYFYLTCVLLFTSLVAGATSTGVLQNSPSGYYGTLWRTLGFTAFLGWSTLIISGLEALAYYFSWWTPFIDQANATSYLITHAIYTGLYTIFWLGAAGSLASTSQGCFRINCSQVKAAAAFSWFSEFCMITSLIFTCILWNRGFQENPLLPKTNPNAGQAPVQMANVAPIPTASNLIERLCIQCHRKQCAENSVFCDSACVAISRNGAPRLVEVPAAHYMFRKVSQLFKTAWTHPTAKPTPQHIFVIISTEDNDRMYKAYREGVESQRRCTAQGMTEGNEQYRWHGTTRECKLGEPGNEALCRSTSCPMCSIIRYSYDVDRFGPRWGRFGKGIYTSATSSKSNDYSKNLFQSQWSALLLNSVVIGNPYTMYENASETFHPPAGYDSILGQPGEVLNYDETVVYRNDAIRPVYLVLYLAPRTPSG